MDINLEMFISNWHLVTLFFTIVSLFAMIVGQYSRKTILKSITLTFIIIYVVVTFIVGFDMHRSEERANYINEGLISTYEQNKGNVNEELVVFVGGFYDDDGNFTSKVFAKNFHESATFEGRVRVAVFDENGGIIQDEVYEVSLNPGEKVEVEPYFGSEEFEGFTYQFDSNH